MTTAASVRAPTRTWRAFVPGIPAPKGSGQQVISKTTGRLVYIPSGGKRLKAWAKAVREVATYTKPKPAFEGAVTVSMTFLIPRPASNRNPYPTDRGKGDIDKLIRATLDELAPVFGDDAKVVTVMASKLWAEWKGQAAEPGCQIDVSEKQ